jgi:hypothetical protein
VAIDELAGVAWQRKHDDPAVPVVPSAPITAFPNSLPELIELCSRRRANERLHAAGSHWALSDAALSDHTFIETHDPGNHHQALGRTLFEVVPRCLHPDFLQHLAARRVAPYDQHGAHVNEGLYPAHVQSGKRVFQLYSELDLGHDHEPESLAVMLAGAPFDNPTYLGPWAFPTLGGAGGQTVFGALNTGTHGGDFHMGPIADAVMAMHLVVDGGRHFWIEPEKLTALEAPLTDPDALRALYGDDPDLGGPDNFAVIRNDDIFNAVLVSAGRFGVIYSFVIGAVRQYTLHQERRLTTWQAIKNQIGDPASPLFTQPADNGFLQVAVSVTPSHNFMQNLAGVTKRNNVPLAPIPGTSEPAGRPERRGAVVQAFDPLLQAPRFSKAGASHTYDPDPAHPGQALPANFLEIACSDANFMQGVIDEVIGEVEDFLASHGAEVGAGIVLATAAGAGGVLALAFPLLAILAVLALLLAELEAAHSPRFGQVMNDVRSSLLDRPDPAEREAGVLVWQAISAKVFSQQQSDSDFEAISYAVMDGHDYLDHSCDVNVDSIEVFFDAADPMLIAFVDSLLLFEAAQEVGQGRAMVGYISLRFTGPTEALIGQQRAPISCAVEVAGLRDVDGTTQLIDVAISLARNPTFNAILHWGQRNPANVADIERSFGDSPATPGGRLGRWRGALSHLTDNGRLDGFSSAFTRQTGLEVVQPIIGVWTADGLDVSWDCERNPPGTEVEVTVTAPDGGVDTIVAQPLTGRHQFAVRASGDYNVELRTVLVFAGERREAAEDTTVHIP